jgi:hypothetical protein
LGRALLLSRPELTLSPAGAVAHWSLNLLPHMEVQWFEADLQAGDGRELDGKFRAAHSSSALAVNTFARFKTATPHLSLAGWSDFNSMRFEAKCPAGVRSRRPPHRESPPNLDLLLLNESKAVGVESKCTEHLSPHVAEFSPAYREQITDWRSETEWFRLMCTLICEPKRYRYLDAAQLVKHAFGLGRCFERHSVSLLYLYWEPRNADMLMECGHHREEVAGFEKEVAGARPSFKAISYRDLWKSWERLSSPAWLPEHLAALKSRYDVEI